MSQRSHIAQSGRIAIIACSAAWSVPRSCGISSYSASCSDSGRYQTASVSNVVSGRSSGTTSSEEPSEIAFFWKPTTCSVTDTRPKESSSPSRCPLSTHLVDDRVGLLLHLGVVVGLEALDDRRARLLVEIEDAVRLAQVEVDRSLVHRRVRALALGRAEDVAGLRVHDQERLAARVAQADLRRREVAARPDPAGLRLLQIREERRAPERLGAERLLVAHVERRLERSRADVAVEDPRIGVVEDGRLDAPVHEQLRLAHEELVERVLGGDQHREPVPLAPGAAPLLAQARDRPREADREGAVERPDVDPQLERIGGGDAEQLALDEPPLDLAALLRRVARRGTARGGPPSPSRRARTRTGG